MLTFMSKTLVKLNEVSPLGDQGARELTPYAGTPAERVRYVAVLAEFAGAEGALEELELVEMLLPPEAERSLEAEVVRQDESGRYGLRFARPVEVAEFARV